MVNFHQTPRLDTLLEEYLEEQLDTDILLDLKKPFIYSLVPIVIENYANQFKELISQKELIIEVIKNEEESFFTTLKQGMDILSSTIKNSIVKKYQEKSF